MNTTTINLLNFLINHIIMIANQMKASAEDFYGAGDYGFYRFLKAEMMEQYIYSGKIAKFIRKMNKGGVIYTEKPAPSHGVTSIQALQNIADMEKATLDKIVEIINMNDSKLAMPFLTDLYCELNKEYYEIHDIIKDMMAIANDSSAILNYDKMLYEEYKHYADYHNSEYKE